MRKFLMIAVMAISVAFAASARDEYSRDVNVLPAAAKTILKSNFKASVSHIKIDRDFGRVSEYTVVLDDGTEVDFDRHGNWKDIEVAYNKSVPSGLLPKGIVEFVNYRHKGAKIVGVDKDRKGYEVQLDNGVELKFNSNGVFKRYDD